MNRPRAVLFDLDDTLLGRELAFDATVRVFYDEHPEIFAAVDWDVALEFFHSLSPLGTIDAQEAALRLNDRWPKLSLDSVEFERWFFVTMSNNAQLIPGVRQFLQDLNESGLPWGIVTNGKKFQITKMECVDLVDLAPFAIVSGLWGAHKPDPSIYDEAVRRIKIAFAGIDNATMSEILFVGDNPYTDITGAATVGMKTAWIRGDYSYPDDAPMADVQIDSVLELRPLLGV